MMVWIGASVVGVLLSVVGVLLVVAPGVRKFCCGAVCGLGVAGVLFFLLQPSTTPEPTREPPAGARVSAQARGTGTEMAVSWVPRAGRPGTSGVPPAPARPEAVSTPEEAAQAVQRFRAAQAVQQTSEEPPAFAGPPASGRPLSETLAPPLATPVPTPPRPATRAAEDHDTVAQGAVTTPSAPHTPYVTVLPPSSLPHRGAPTTLVLPLPSAPIMGSAVKSCEVLKAEIQAKLAAKGLTGYVLTIMTSGDVQGPEIVGSCEGNTRKIVLYRLRNAP
jgi:Protein of unknown function (DUF1161)